MRRRLGVWGSAWGTARHGVEERTATICVPTRSASACLCGAGWARMALYSTGGKMQKVNTSGQGLSNFQSVCHARGLGIDCTPWIQATQGHTYGSISHFAPGHLGIGRTQRGTRALRSLCATRRAVHSAFTNASLQARDLPSFPGTIAHSSHCPRPPHRPPCAAVSSLCTARAATQGRTEPAAQRPGPRPRPRPLLLLPAPHPCATGCPGPR